MIGWVNNYRMASIQSKLKALDEWLRNRLRYCIWHDWKKLERKRKNLIRLGIEQGQAYAWSRTRMGGWGSSPKPYFKDYNYFVTSKAERVCPDAGLLLENATSNSMNRCIREPYVQWCVRRTGDHLVVSRLHD